VNNYFLNLINSWSMALLLAFYHAMDPEVELPL